MTIRLVLLYLLLLVVIVNGDEKRQWGHSDCDTVSGDDEGRYLVLGNCIGSGVTKLAELDMDDGLVQNITTVELPLNNLDNCSNETAVDDKLFATCNHSLVEFDVSLSSNSYSLSHTYNASNSIESWSKNGITKYVTTNNNTLYEFTTADHPDAEYSHFFKSWDRLIATRGYLSAVSPSQVGFFHSPPITGSSQFEVVHNVHGVTIVSSSSLYTCVVTQCEDCDAALLCFSPPNFFLTNTFDLSGSSPSLLRVVGSYAFMLDNSQIATFDLARNMVLEKTKAYPGNPISLHPVIVNTTFAQVYYVLENVSLCSTSVVLDNKTYCDSCFPFRASTLSLEESINTTESFLYASNSILTVTNPSTTSTFLIDQSADSTMFNKWLFTEQGNYLSGCKYSDYLLLPPNANGPIIQYDFIKGKDFFIQLPSSITQTGWIGAEYLEYSKEVYLVPGRSNYIVILNVTTENAFVSGTIKASDAVDANVDLFSGSVLVEDYLYLATEGDAVPQVIDTQTRLLYSYKLNASITLPVTGPYWSSVAYHAGFVYFTPANSGSDILMCPMWEQDAICESAGNVSIISNNGYSGIEVLRDHIVLLPNEGALLVSFKTDPLSGKIIESTVTSGDYSYLVGGQVRFSSVEKYGSESLLLTPSTAGLFVVLSYQSGPPATASPSNSRIHNSDDGVTLGVVVFCLLFAVVFFACCLYCHTIEPDNDARTYVKYKENSDGADVSSPSPQPDKVVEEELHELSIAE
eukprot:TRINITY_DN9196_c2_g1_i1.p1 TRINITY_DN9196_c2_g1~~TRINITY_DN9196_c2_g1_i1.p1  ORF type:complete len:746 (+),score=120.25 TRINITY_DN9196_c2_g1_i1:117-2354(+)